MSSRPRRVLLGALALGAASAAFPSKAAEPEAEADFVRYVKPILESACVRCHGAEEQEAELMLDSQSGLLAGGESGPAVVPGKPEESLLYTLAALPADDPDVMPPKESPLDESQLARLRDWIAAGAPWPEGVRLEKQPRMEFAKHIQPILELSCVGCHKPGKLEGGLNIENREAAFTTGDSGPSIKPFSPEDSLFLQLTMLEADDEDLMPPKRNGGPLPSQEVDQLRLWIAQGAVWPASIELKQRSRGQEDRPPSPDNAELIERVRAFILEQSKEQSAADMAAYSATVPRTDATYHMVPIPGGEFQMGSPDSEASRNVDEGPQFTAQIEPFWMGKYEVTWDEYEPFMITPVDRYKDGSKKNRAPEDTDIDAVSMPTTPYTEMSFGMGQGGFPAISMTEHAANKYCQWLSAQTGHFYRLPTEAEWEYACRAGTTTAYSFGDDPSQLAEHGWFFENSDGKYQKVGKKKPNPWGLYDMHGNVMEWTLDQYFPDGYSRLASEGGAAVSMPWNRPATLYPRVARGGHWDSDPQDLRSAARTASSAAWKRQDPQLPKSIWYLTDAKVLGFRLVRPLRVPSTEEMAFYWNCGRPELIGGKKAVE